LLCTRICSTLDCNCDEPWKIWV